MAMTDFLSWDNLNWPWSHHTASRSHGLGISSRNIDTHVHDSFKQPSYKDPMETWRIGDLIVLSFQTYFPTYEASLWEARGVLKKYVVVLR